MFAKKLVELSSDIVNLVLASDLAQLAVFQVSDLVQIQLGEPRAEYCQLRGVMRSNGLKFFLIRKSRW